MGYRVAGPHVVAEKIEGEILVVDLATGFYYSVLHGGVDLWEAAVAGADRDQIVATMLERFDGVDGSVGATVDGFLERLLEENLIVEDEDVALGAPLSNNGRRPYKAPVFERYDDMQDLILLDPVHEIDPKQGWPRAKDDATGDKPAAKS